jgi:exodeoxyribonuclease VII large subunit
VFGDTPSDQTISEQGQLALRFEPTPRVYGVSELNARIQQLFDAQFRGVWVTGEISGCKQASSGHYYFNLKDGESQLKCVLFRGSARFLKFRPQDGLAVAARGSVEIYQERGDYQLVVELLEPRGAGALQLAFEQLKARLAAEGLFEPARKKRLPTLPLRIGIVTSPTGAVIRDIIQVLDRRFSGLHIRVYPSLVQGEGAAEQIVRGIMYFSDGGWAQALILARGGGGLDDLWAFNEEAVARAIAGCRVPVISGVGHETDFTIADFVADLRAPTPSAAAEMVIPTKQSLMEQLATAEKHLVQGVRYRLALYSKAWREQGLARSQTVLHRYINRRMQQLDDLETRLRELKRENFALKKQMVEALLRRLHATDVRLHLGRAKESLERADRRMTELVQRELNGAGRRFETAQANLKQLSPVEVLSRGYAIVSRPDGAVLRSASATAAGEAVRIRFHQGSAQATITGTE